MRKTLLAKMQVMERRLGLLPANRPKNFKDPLFGQYHVAVKDCRYDALNNYRTHLLFAIIVREEKLHQPAGFSGESKPKMHLKVVAVADDREHKVDDDDIFYRR